MATLKFILEDGQEVVVPLQGAVTLGSDSGNDVVVDNEHVSARHAEVRHADDESYEVCDLNSKTGTFVNGERVQRRRLVHGDKVLFGPLSGIFCGDPVPVEKNTTQESKHAQLLLAIQALGVQHDLKTAEVESLTAAAGIALRDLEAVNAQKEEALGQLQSLHKERTAHEEGLQTIRQQCAEMETRCREAQILAEAREDQVGRAEKKLALLDRQRVTLETRLAEIGNAAQQLQKVQADCVRMEGRHAELSAEITDLNESRKKAVTTAAELEGGIARLKTEHNQHRAEIDEITAEHHHAEELLRLILSQKEAHEGDCAVARKTLSAVRNDLGESQKKHTELKRLCDEHAGTEERLVASRETLQAVETRRSELDEIVRGLEEQRGKNKTILDDILREEEEANGRIKALTGRETDLRAALEDLSARERQSRARFVEIQKLATDADHEHTTQMNGMKRAMEESQRELADLEIKLAPLRDWKDAMDKRYARLASLPEDSAEARELWREIEHEKAGLRNLISASPGATRSINLDGKVLTQLTSPDAFTSGVKKTGPTKGQLPAPPALTDETAAPEERANVGQTGTGALISGTGQEMALKARINRLRESVQREAVRLEFLRQERAREETRLRGGSDGGAMMREQERQMDVKIRREEEHYATLQRKLEIGEMEEEKRREKIAEMERKITELRADIADAEHKRSDARHQADITQTELKNYEAALDRMKKLVEL